MNDTDKEIIKTRDECMDELILKHKGLVGHVINIHFPKYKGDEDFFQEGLVGLWNAIKNYKGINNCRFTTYAVSCIRYTLTDVVRKQYRIRRRLDMPGVCVSLYEAQTEGDNPELTLSQQFAQDDESFMILEIDDYLQRQPPEEKLSIQLRILGHSIEDILEATKLPRNKERRVWQRFRKEVSKWRV